MANVAQHKIFHEKPSFVNKKMDEKSRLGELSAAEIQEIVDNVIPVTTKKAIKFGMRLFNGTYQLSFPEKMQNFKYDCRDLHIHEYYITTTFTLMLQNGLLVLVAPNFRN